MTDDVEQEWERAGLYDPAAPDAEARLELLAYLAEVGVTTEEMVAAEAVGELVSSGGDKRLHFPRTLTRAEYSERSGLTPEQVDRAWLAAGLAAVPEGEPGFAEADVELLTKFAMASVLFGYDAVLQITRVLGASLARRAVASISTFLVNEQRPWAEQGAGPAALARANVEGVELLSQLLDALTPMFQRHVEAAVLQTRATRENGELFDVFRLTVGFVDLVGFTSWSQQLSTDELAAALNDFERASGDIVTQHGARVVKNIGDAVMFITPDPVAACTTALELCRWVDEHPVLTRLRGAVATGDVLSRDGDYYGPIVNLAARAVKEAQPGAVIVTSAVARALDGGFAPSSIGAPELRGVGESEELFEISRR
jgi:adenylate cyclase